MGMPIKIAEMKCWKCGKKGHFESYCKRDRKEEGTKKAEVGDGGREKVMFGGGRERSARRERLRQFWTPVVTAVSL